MTPQSTEQRDVAASFAAAMARLGPFEPRPRMAAGVSGGADSMALACLAAHWVAARHGSLLALVVDHGLRQESGCEAALTVARLSSLGIATETIRLDGLLTGPGVAERARAARYRALAKKCGEAGILHLLLGHHAADQAETVMLRVLGHSGDRGLAGMPALAETATLRLLRPLLGTEPDRLRRMLADRGVGWVEDPSNTNQKALRARLRRVRGPDDPAGTAALCDAAANAGRQRAVREEAVAGALARSVSLRPEGFALLPHAPLPPGALAAVILAIAGAAYPPRGDGVASLASNPRPATLAGTRLLQAGRLGPGLMLVREEAAMAPSIAACPGAIWDGRFRFAANAELPEGAVVGPLGADAAHFRRGSNLPSVVLRTLPAIWCGKNLAVVPHLLYPDAVACARVRLMLSLPRPVAGAPFKPFDVAIE
jgi:tRNA(Ile)-lysidine synthase